MRQKVRKSGFLLKSGEPSGDGDGCEEGEGGSEQRRTVMMDSMREQRVERE